MKFNTYHGVVKGQTIVILDQPLPLPDGTPVAVTPLASELGSPAAVLAAMESEPHLTPEDVADLEQAISTGRRPPARIDPFDQETQEAGLR